MADKKTKTQKEKEKSKTELLLPLTRTDKLHNEVIIMKSQGSDESIHGLDGYYGDKKGG